MQIIDGVPKLWTKILEILFYLFCEREGPPRGLGGGMHCEV